MTEKLSKLYFITHEKGNNSPAQQVEDFCAGGGKLVQLRFKGQKDEAIRAQAAQCLSVCKSYGVICLLNDRVQLAQELGFDGVHLGQQDMPPSEARKILGNKAIIGGTANDLKEAKYMISQQVDYLGVGPFRFTSTKKKLSPLLGLQGYEILIQKLSEEGISIPVFAIGGVQRDDIHSILGTGVYGVAISGDIALAGSVQEKTQQYLSAISSHHKTKEAHGSIKNSR